MSFTAGLRACLTVTSSSIWMGETARLVVGGSGRSEFENSASNSGGRANSSSKSL